MAMTEYTEAGKRIIREKDKIVTSIIYAKQNMRQSDAIYVSGAVWPRDIDANIPGLVWTKISSNKQGEIIYEVAVPGYDEPATVEVYNGSHGGYCEQSIKVLK